MAAINDRAAGCPRQEDLSTRHAVATFSVVSSKSSLPIMLVATIIITLLQPDIYVSPTVTAVSTRFLAMYWIYGSCNYGRALCPCNTGVTAQVPPYALAVTTTVSLVEVLLLYYMILSFPMILCGVGSSVMVLRLPAVLTPTGHGSPRMCMTETLTHVFESTSCISENCQEQCMQPVYYFTKIAATTSNSCCPAKK